MAEVKIDEANLVSLKDQVVVITGGSAGIGLATVKLLLKLGAQIVVGDLNPPPEPEAAQTTFLKTDVTSWEDQSALFQKAYEVHGRIDHVFANAGIANSTNFLKDKVDDNGMLKAPDLTTYNINLIGCMYTLRLGVFFLKKNPKGGSVVLNASVASFQGLSVVDYCASKHGVLGLLRSTTAHLTPDLHIRINCLAPDWTETALVPGKLFRALGVAVQGPEPVALSAVLCMADTARNGQLIYSSQGEFKELEARYTPWVAGLLGKESMSIEEAMARVRKFEAKAKVAGAGEGGEPSKAKV